MSSGSVSPPPPPGPRSPTSAGHLTRHNTASSVGSGQYSALPPGKWFLDLHGSCPRCHHQHSGVQVKVNAGNTPDDNDTVSHVHCEGCHGKWLAFGGRNTTRISLLSTLSSKPDLVEKEVRNTVIAMIKSATAMSAVGSPRLAGISESPLDTTARPNSTILPAGAAQVEQTEERTRRVSFHPTVGRDAVQEWPFPTEKRPSPCHHGSPHTQSSISLFLDRVKAHLPISIRFRSRKLLLKKFQGARQDDKLKSPVEPPSPVHVATTEKTPVPTPSEEQQAVNEGNDAETKREAAEFIDTFQNEDLQQMDDAQRVRWGRETIAAFRKERHRATAPRNGGTDTATQVDAEDLVPTDSIRAHHQRTYDLLHVGSHHGLFDRWSSDLLRSRPLSVSTDRTSEAVTVVPDNGARYSWLDYLQRERRGSAGSQRSVRGFLQRQRGADGRLSFDSMRSTVAVRNSSTSRGTSMNRVSNRSMVRLSTLALPDQTVTERSDDDGVTISQLPHGTRNASPSRPTSA